MELLAVGQWPQRSVELWGCPTIAEAKHLREDIFTTDWKTHSAVPEMFLLNHL